MASLLLKDVLQGREGQLGLRQIAGEAGLMRSTSDIRVQRYDKAQGFGERIIPDVILVINPQCISKLTTISSESRTGIFQTIISNRIPLIAVSETETIPDSLLPLSEVHGITLFTSVHDEFLLESRLSRLLREKIENSISVHGSFVNVSGLGVIFVGDSGAGKTQCALELVRRGHRWIADDAVEVERRGDLLYGRSHELVKRLINVRSSGIVDAEELLGSETILDDSVINLMVELKRTDQNEEQNMYPEEELRDIMGIKLPCMELAGFPRTRRIYEHIELRVQKLMNEMGRGGS